MNYEKKKLKDCCVSISDGDHQPPPKSEAGVPFITISNIDSNNQLDFSDVMYVPEEYYNGLPANKKATIGDILYSVVGSFGRPVYISKDDKFVFQRHIAILKVNDDVDSKYLYYTMLNPMFYRMADKLAIGCAQRTITLDALRNIVIDVPPIERQRSITNALKAIDDKITLNNRINDNLEQQATLLYDYWFLQFEFPDETGKPYKSSGGAMTWNNQLQREIPVGWSVTTLKGLFNIERGVSYTSKDIESEKGTPMINLASVDTNRNYKPGELKYYSGRNAEKAKLRAYDLLIACTDLTRNADIVGCPILVPADSRTYIYSMDMAKITSATSKLDEMYLYMTLRTDFYHNYIKRWASGTNVLHLNLDGLDWYTTWLPPVDLQKRFSDIVKGIHKQKCILMEENENLTSLRNWLLPMLMNGQATVCD